MGTKQSVTGEARVPTRKSDFTNELIEPFTQLKSEVDRLFEAFPFRLPTISFDHPAIAPAVDMTETATMYRITAELPGIDADKIEVTFENGMLRIAGEKQQRREENERGYRFSERSYGSFERLIELPAAGEPKSMRAKFRNGLLTVTVPKKDGAPKGARKIQIHEES